MLFISLDSLIICVFIDIHQYYTPNESLQFSLSDHIFNMLNILYVFRKVEFNQFIPLLFVGQGSLAYYCILDIDFFQKCQKYSSGGNCV